MTPQQYIDACAILEPQQARELLLARRQALLIELAALERYLKIPRSVPTKQEKERQNYLVRQGELS